MSEFNAFISHSSSDELVANAIVDSLERNRIRCWIAPRDISVGSDYGAEITKGIRESSLFILIFSSACNESKHCARELELALKNDRVIVPLRIESHEPTEGMAYRLSTVQWVEAPNKQLDEHALKFITGVAGLSEKRDNTTLKTPEYIVLNRCGRCGSQFQEHNSKGCSYHAEQPILIGKTEADRNYSDIWQFPCCGQKYLGAFTKTSGGQIIDTQPPASPGCVSGQHVPKYPVRMGTAHDILPEYMNASEISKFAKLLRKHINVLALDSIYIWQTDDEIVVVAPTGLIHGSEKRQVEDFDIETRKYLKRYGLNFRFYYGDNDGPY